MLLARALLNAWETMGTGRRVRLCFVGSPQGLRLTWQLRPAPWLVSLDSLAWQWLLWEHHRLEVLLERVDEEKRGGDEAHAPPKPFEEPRPHPELGHEGLRGLRNGFVLQPADVALHARLQQKNIHTSTRRKKNTRKKQRERERLREL